MVKILEVRADNVKRLVALVLKPTANGLTIIGGKNGQGKTSALDLVAWMLGGEKYRPSNPRRDDAEGKTEAMVKLDNGLTITRDGKNHTLKVVDQTGGKHGQAILNDNIGEFAIDLPKFLESKDRGTILLSAIGVGDELRAIEKKESDLFTRRTAVGKEGKTKRAHADDLPCYENAPKEETASADLMKELRDAMAMNCRNTEKLSELADARMKESACRDYVCTAEDALREAKENQQKQNRLVEKLEAECDALPMDIPTAEIESRMKTIDATNAEVRSNATRKAASDEATALEAQYATMTEDIERLRASKTELFAGADLPLPGLTVVEGELLYNGQAWDCMSGSEQMIVAASIARKLKPSCEFLLIDKMEQYDLDTLTEFGEWAELEGLQIIGTRVSTGEECTIIIEDGSVKN